MKIIISEKQLGVLKKPKESKEKNYDILFVAGFDDKYNPSYDSFQEQLLKLKSVLNNKKIKGFPWNTSDSEILSFLEKNPNLSVFLFSKGCEKIGLFISNPNVSLSDIYLIEPWAKGKSKNKYITAISSGLPSSNIFVGPTDGRGFGIQGASSSRAKGHFNSLLTVPTMIKL